MAAEQLIEDPVFNVRYRFSRIGDEGLLVETLAEPGGGVLVEHYHPTTEERFEVRAGEFTFTVDGEERRVAAGERIVAEPGVRHTFQNTGESPGHVVTEASPALGLQGFLEETAALARAGKYTKRGLPTGVGAALEAAEVIERYRDTVVLTDTFFPPAAIQPILLGPIARLQRWRQKRAAAGGD
jgi:quercetin dioxygenase-like cupin family protein